MWVFTKANGLKAVLCLVGIWVLFCAFLSYIDTKTVNYSTFRKLSIRHMHRYYKLDNISSDVLINKNESLSVNHTIFSQDVESQLSRVSIGDNNITTYDNGKSNKDSIPNTAFINRTCKTPKFDESKGPITPNTTLESLDIVEATLAPFLKTGGAFEPNDCIPNHHVAIVVPFRDRYAHLAVFLRNIHPFLMKQHIAYRIFLIEQTNGKAFNRASLMNIGFLEALKIFPWDCFIFHDVDLLPLDNRNLYTCPRQPRHMSVAIDTLNFKLPYRSIFGGVSAMTRKQFQLVNGFSNSYFGWGGEDDDMSNRLKHANLFISRYPVNIARYMMLKHPKEKANPKRYENLVNGINKMEMDGINSIKYNIYSIKEFPTFTWYLAELKIPDQTS
ncbi:beta-1,4-N-acetylgalactosaminyltransferase bre-4 [Eurosta solidaginis]|uniref:beta-1,4-N-acetylgalactosaminyltransferase bre-4 n=1 Tax=Eurosta solidaginis TaxID=178769 RepID=UPI0035315BE4